MKKVKKQPAFPSKERPRKVVILFGLPGSGKTTGSTAAKKLGFYVYNADRDYTPAMKEAMQKNLPIPEEERDNYYQLVVEKIKALLEKYPFIIVDHWFPRDRHRTYVKNQIPNCEFVLITTPNDARVERLTSGKRVSPIANTNPEYYVKVSRIFESPTIDHKVISNNDSLEKLTKKIKLALKS